MTSAYNQGQVPVIEVRHRLRIAREYVGLDQDQLAQRMEVTRSTISNAENGHGSPRRSTINAWALACGVPATWLRTGKEPHDDPDPNSGLRIIRTEPKVCAQQRSVLRAVQSGSEASNKDAA